MTVKRVIKGVLPGLILLVSVSGCIKDDRSDCGYSHSALSIQLTDGNGNPVTELVFANKATILPQTLQVDWQPVDATLTVAKAAVGSLAQPSGTGIPDADITGGNGGTGKYIYTITPDAFSDTEIDPVSGDPLLEKVSKIDFATTNGISDANESVFLRQVNYAVVPVGGSDCLLDGEQYSFGIRSNTAWKIKSVTQKLSDDTETDKFLALQSDDNLKENATGGYNVSPAGETIKFTVINDLTKTLLGTIEVVFSSPDGLFDDVTVIIRIVDIIWSRSNIVWIPDNTLPSGGILTFAVTPTDNAAGRTILFDDNGTERSVSAPAIPANVQGVNFKWGSLVAVNPVGSPYTSSKILFSPTGTYNNDWGEVPYFNSMDFAREPWNNNIPEEDDFENYDGSSNTSGPGYDASGRGDICRYISAMGWVEGNWRLSTGAEINELLAEGKENAGGFNYNNNVGTNSDGFNTVNAGWFLGDGVSLLDNKTNPQYGIFVPASGGRFPGGSAQYAGTVCNFWSGSSSHGANGYYMYMYSDLASRSSTDRLNGFPIRCVRKL